MQIRTCSSLLIIQLGLLSRSRALADDVPSLLQSRTTIPAPVVVGASQDWDGNDGPWSSFPIQVGTPSQNVKVMISTSGHQTLVVIPGGCIGSDPSDCETLRGGFFDTNQSTSYEVNNANLSSNIYPLLIDEDLGYSPNGALGFDDVTLGWQGSGGPTLNNQTIAGFIDKDFYLGYFGLTPRASNFTSFDDPIPSYMQNLKSKSMIPSLSWSYTAGNQYRLNQVLGSLVLGGYDTSKFVPNDVTFPFGAQDIRDLTVQLEAITMTDNATAGTSLLPNSIPVFVDSSLPYIWLPVEACALFEEAFGLVWDNTTELYLLNSTHRSTLRAQNANVTFTLGNLTPGQTVNITLPYSAFDLTVSSPITTNSTPYFPLKRAVNSTQYTLGRTFFQEAYVTADYERGNFSVSQCSWVANPQQNIVSIISPSQASTSNSTSSSSGSNNTSSHVSTGAVAGGVVGGVVLLTAVALLLYYSCIKPRRHRREAAAAAATAGESEEPAAAAAQTGPTDDPTMHKAELSHEDAQRAAEMEDPIKNQWVVETEGSTVPPIHEMDAKRRSNMRPSEMEGGGPHVWPAEVDGQDVWRAEMDGREVEVHEMPAREEVAAEMMTHTQGDDIERAPPRWSWVTTPGPVSPPWSEKRDEEVPSPPVSSPPISSPPISEQSPRSVRGRFLRSSK